MKLYRFKAQGPEVEPFKQIEEITLDDLDLKNRKTLFLFPGMDNPSPMGPFPPPPEDAVDLKRYGKLHALLPRGTVYAQQAQRDEKPIQVVMVTWNSFDECRERLHSLAEKPARFYSDEAAAFMEDLYARKFDPDKISVMAWSYGTCFAQECANYVRIHEKEKERTGEEGCNPLPPIYVVGTATVTNLANNAVHGFPGFYMYAWNDKILKEYVGDEQETLYRNIFTKPQWSVPQFRDGQGGMEKHAPLSLIKSGDRDDHVMAVVTTPDRIFRQRQLPAGPHVMNSGQRKWETEAEKETPDPDCHMPVGFTEARSKSTYTSDKDGEMKAWRHSRYFQRVMHNVLCRDGAIDYADILFDHSKGTQPTEQAVRKKQPGKRKDRGRSRHAELMEEGQRFLDGRSDVALNDEIHALLGRFQCEVDEDGRFLSGQALNFEYEQHIDVDSPHLTMDAKFKEEGRAFIQQLYDYKKFALNPRLTDSERKRLDTVKGAVVKKKIGFLHYEIRKHDRDEDLYRVNVTLRYKDPSKPEPSDEEMQRIVADEMLRFERVFGRPVQRLPLPFDETENIRVVNRWLPEPGEGENVAGQERR